MESKLALQVAETWLAANPTPMVSDPAGKQWKAMGIRPFLGYSGDVLAYIIDLKPQGFIIVPADDEIEPILTFSTESNFSGLLGPDEVLADILSRDIPGRISSKGRLPLEYRDKVAERWAKARNAALQTDGQIILVGTVSPVVNPLVTDTWNQGGEYAPFTYNYCVPNHYITGCVATAMGMIVHYYRYPSSASCTNTIYLAGTPTVVSFNDTFDYDLMPTSISGTSPLANIQEVAKLLFDCGVSINMQYNTAANGGSGAYTTQVPTALRTTFGYTSATWKNGYDADWASVLKNELSAGYPVEMEIWSHQNPSNPAGHAIVCDGWGTEDGADRLHLNMGWGGYSNNWYAVPGFSAGGYTWDEMSGYVYNIRKPNMTQTAAPTMNPDAGTYYTSQNVTLSCTTPGAVIHYTTNGAIPTVSDPVASGFVQITSNLTLKAKAWKTGLTPSDVVSAIYVFQAGTPTFDPDGGTGNSAQYVTVACATPGAVIRYTTSGADPTDTSPVVSGPVFVSRSLTLKAKAWRTGWAASTVKSASFTIVPLSTSRKQINGATVSIPRAVVTAAPERGYFYVEADDRSSGVMVYKSGYRAILGARVTVAGTVGTASSGEKCVTATSITNAGTGVIEPIAMINRNVGGGDWYYNTATGAGQQGVKDSSEIYSRGLNNIGLLITTTGRVTYSVLDYFYIDDGSRLADNSGYIGCKVLGSVPSPTPLGAYVKVTGISTCFKEASPSTDLYRQISATQVVLIQ